MSYYGTRKAGYYRGDYYRGDPFIGALVGAVAGGAVKRAGSWIAGRIGGSAAKKAVQTVARDAAPGIVGGAVGYTLGQKSMPTLSPLPQGGSEWGTDATMEQAWREGWRPMRRRRRINPLNPKALRRALRRAAGFEKFAQKTVNALYRVIDGKKVRTFKRK